MSAVATLLLALFAAGPASATIKYRVSLAHNEEHLFQVEMEIPNVAQGTEVAMPVWNALYQVRDFAVRIHDLQLVQPAVLNLSAPPAILLAVNKQTWRIVLPQSQGSAAPQGATVILRYSIEWDDAGPFNSQLDAHHAFVNFAEILLYLPTRRSESTDLAFTDVPAEWKLVAELPSGDEPNSFSAESYDALVDAPLEAGKFSSFSFDNQGAHFRVAVDGDNWNKRNLEDYLRGITSYELRLMGGPPFKEYTFLFHIGPYPDVGGGGMEHSNSTAIAAPSVESAATIAAHEFFHAWNVKRIRPQTLEPVDYSKEQPTRALWFAEGVTSTYGAYTLERAGLWTKDQFYGDLAMQIDDLESRPARRWESAEGSSLAAWLEKYDDYNTPGRSISYYNKGQLIGVFLDLSIRDATDNQKSLDDVLRAMNAEYAKAGKFYDESDGIRQVVEEVSGGDYKSFFQRFVSGTDEIPYQTFLSAAGLELKTQTTESTDLGFRPEAQMNKSVMVTNLEPGSAAEAAGIRDGDIILPPRDKSSSKDTIEWLAQRAAGDPLVLRIRRGGQELELSFLVSSHEDRQYSISEISHPSEKQRRIRDGWLHGATGQ